MILSKTKHDAVILLLWVYTSQRNVHTHKRGFCIVGGEVNVAVVP